MPLTMANTNESYIIKRVGGKDTVKKFLETLGFNVGSEITVVNEVSGNLIVNVKESRVAISKEMAIKIQV